MVSYAKYAHQYYLDQLNRFSYILYCQKKAYDTCMGNRHIPQGKKLLLKAIFWYYHFDMLALQISTHRLEYQRYHSQTLKISHNFCVGLLSPQDLNLHGNIQSNGFLNKKQEYLKILTF